MVAKMWLGLLNLLSKLKPLCLILAALFLGVLYYKQIVINNQENRLSEQKIKIAQMALQIELLNQEAQICDEKIAFNNAKIKSLQINEDKIKNSQKALNERFKKIKEPKNQECEENLKFYKELFNEASF